MINYLWLGLIITGFIVGGITGQIDKVSEAIFQGAEDSVRLTIDLLGPIALWLGIMNIAQKSGFTQLLGRLIKPLINLIFPGIPDGHPARGAIVLNMVANMLGLGNSATPLGIKAMQELQDINPKKERASFAMCTLLALNTSSITIIPATIISLRVACNSNNPTIIIVSSIFATSISTVTALFFDRFFRVFTRE
ncbi:nucleoside recognition protein [Iocasia frigidifontis]|uniref:Nucleoside recognition protein n=1 Tax=Iocasia fonsfrigidae TaxID=2682810 RepID=A0A8A7K9A8_9FIRM|nr:nucleoside recognition domain-containing protein [Iocasia fonsfrigidae]QTL98336.1 nucleoside recognition protein [Iocasia fonsfrigidae]